MLKIIMFEHVCVSQRQAFLKIICMRHGQSTHNVKHVYNANRSHPNYEASWLTKEGIAQVKASIAALQEQGIVGKNVIASYVSPLPRAIQTAAYLVEAGIIDPMTLKEEERLIDDNPGDKEGQTIGNENQWDHSKAHEYNGENEEDVIFRVTTLFNDIKAAHKEGIIICIGHGTSIGLFLNVLRKTNYNLGQPEITLPTAGFQIVDI